MPPPLTFEIEGASFTQGEVKRTPFGCPDEHALAQETAFLAALTTAMTITLDGDGLAIAYDGGKLRFVPEPTPPALSLNGTHWWLTAFKTSDGIQSPVPGTMITADFAGGKMTGLAGCNSYSGTYVSDGHSFAIVETVMTVEACFGQAAMAQEEAYMEALHSAESYTVDDHTLTIVHDDGTLFFTTQSTSIETVSTLQK
jgi:heat shock protein HslJ